MSYDGVVSGNIVRPNESCGFQLANVDCSLLGLLAFRIIQLLL